MTSFWRRVRSVVFVVIAAVLGFVPMQSLLLHNRVAAEPTSWLAAGNPTVSFSDLSSNYEVPYSYNYNTDCYTQSFNIITREAKPWPNTQAEQRRSSSCAVLTPRGMTDGTYLDAGVPAGRFATSSGGAASVFMIPRSNKLITSYFNGITLELSTYESIVPRYNSTTGEVQFRLSPAVPQSIRDGSGAKYYFRSGSLAYSSDGGWMIAETTVGFVRVNLVTNEVLPFAIPLNYNSGFDPAPRVAISPDGRYAALASGNGLFSIYDLASCASVPPHVTGPVACQSKNVQPFLTSTFPGYKVSYYIRFASPDMLTFITGYTDSSGATKRASVHMVPNGQTIESVNYLALGDSFSSGEGIGNYYAGTDEPENKCHLSPTGYPGLVSQALNITSFHSVACSGAKTSAYYDAQPDQRPNSNNVLGKWLPGVDSQQGFLQTANPNTVTISMTGNDIGFSDKLQTCLVGPDSCFHFREDRKNTAEEIRSKFGPLVDLYKNVKDNHSTQRVYVLGYPQLVSMDTSCTVNVVLDAEEREFSRGLITYLNAVIKAATEKAGVQYVDVENTFSGHQLCDGGNKAVNGLTQGNDIPNFFNGPIANESYHPTQLGHQLLSEALLAQTYNFTTIMPSPNTNRMAPSEGSAPHDALLEPISKMPQKNKNTGQVHEANVVGKCILVSRGYSPVIL